MYRSYIPRDLFAQIERLQRELQQPFGVSPSIRGAGRGGYPGINIGSTQDAFEIVAFAPGLEASSIEVQIEKGVLTLSGERASDLPTRDDKITLHIAERFSGRFRRVLSLPDDVQPEAVSARYRDGVLHIKVPRRVAAQSHRINIE